MIVAVANEQHDNDTLVYPDWVLFVVAVHQVKLHPQLMGLLLRVGAFTEAALHEVRENS